MIGFQFRVTERHDDGEDEEFGTEMLDAAPNVGDVIDLHWLSGAVAYPVEVLEVRLDPPRLFVRSVGRDVP